MSNKWQSQVFEFLADLDWSLRSRPSKSVRNVFRERKTPRPAGKPGGDDYSRRACGPSDATQALGNYE